MLAQAQVTAMMPSKDMERARRFYEEALKLSPEMILPDGSVFYRCAEGTGFSVFPSSGASDGSFTQLGFWVADVEEEMRDLRSRGVVFEEYDLPGLKTEDGIVNENGWKGAWFKDPDGNLLSIGEGEMPE